MEAAASGVVTVCGTPDAPAPTGSLGTFTEAFLRFETERELFSLEAEGHRFWDYLRYAVFYEHVNATIEHVSPSTVDRRRPVALAATAARVFHDRLRPPLRGRCDIVALNYVRDRPFDGRMVNIQLYPFIKAVAPRYSVVLLDPAEDAGNDGRYPCRVRSIWGAEVMDRARGRLHRFPRDFRATCRSIGDCLGRDLGVRVDLETLAAHRLSFQLASYRRYYRLLARLRPRLVVYSDTATQKGLIAAAHALGILTVDLQHSLMSHVNILYRYMPGQSRLATMSDVILTFGEYWQAEYRLPAQTCAVGFPYLEAERARAWPMRKSAPERGRNILILSDATYSRSAFVSTAIELARLLPDHHVFYKLRPDDYEGWRTRYPDLSGAANLSVIASDEVSLYEHFGRCAWQVGINSTALYEGMAFGLRTFVLRTGWYEEMQAAYDGGYAYLAMDAADIACAVASDWTPRGDIDVDRMFRPDGARNIAATVDLLMTRGSNGSLALDAAW